MGEGVEQPLLAVAAFGCGRVGQGGDDAPFGAEDLQLLGTGKVAEEKVANMLMDEKVFDFRPGMLVKELGLKTPKGWNYRQTATGGHFGRPEFPWEKTDKVEAIQAALGC